MAAVGRRNKTEKTKRIGFLARGGALSLSAELAGGVALRSAQAPILCGVKAASAALVRSDLGQAGGEAVH